MENFSESERSDQRSLPEIGQGSSPPASGTPGQGLAGTSPAADGVPGQDLVKFLAGTLGASPEKIIIELPAPDPTWTAVQHAIRGRLVTLDPKTLKRRGKRFEHFLTEGVLSNYLPKTRDADRALRSVLITGCMLQAFSSNKCVADEVQRRYEEGETIHCPDRLELVGDENYQEFEVVHFQPRTPRRDRIQCLPKNWFVTSMRASKGSAPGRRAAHLVLGLTGARPCEISSALIKIDDAEGVLQITIRTAKTAQRKTMADGEFRTLFLSMEPGPLQEFIQELASIIRVHGDQVTRNVNERSVENLMSELSAKLWPYIKPGLNASCFRVQMAADLKKDSFDRGVIAYLLGHSMATTASIYGVFKQGVAGHRACLFKYHHTNMPCNAAKPSSERPKGA